LILVAAPAAANAATVYSSLPLQGASRTSAKAVNDGARLALEEAGNPVRFVMLDDSTAQAGAWTPEATAANARRAAQDADALAYLGEFNSGASMVSLPILNEAGIPMISPSNTFIGLTKRGEPGEPDKFYPTGVRTYFRIVPNDAIQAAALATAMRDRSCQRIAVLNDGEAYGHTVASGIRATARRLGLAIRANKRIDRNAANYRKLARGLKGSDCVVFAGTTANNAVQLFKDVGRTRAKAKLFASDGVAEAGFVAELPRSVAKRMVIAVQTLAPNAYGPPAPAVFVRNRDPYAIYGYEAMKLILDGYRAGATTRAAMLQWLKGVKDRPSALGTYSFDPDGDTTLRVYGLYTIRHKRLTWAGAVTAN
jgi:branched-chain amino acid transport system substrate-binding protein